MFCLSSTKDCKCNVNGSTGCDPSGKCISKDNYDGSQCQQRMLNSFFKTAHNLVLTLDFSKCFFVS